MKKERATRVYLGVLPFVLFLICHVGTNVDRWLDELFKNKSLASPVHFIPFLVSLIFGFFIYSLIRNFKNEKDRGVLLILSAWICFFIVIWIPFIFPIPPWIPYRSIFYTGFWAVFFKTCNTNLFVFFYILFAAYLYLIFQKKEFGNREADKAAAPCGKNGRIFRIMRSSSFYFICAPIFLFAACYIGRICNDYAYVHALQQFKPFAAQIVPFVLGIVLCILIIMSVRCYESDGSKRMFMILLGWITIFSGIIIPIVLYCFLYNPHIYTLGGLMGPKCFWIFYKNCLTTSYILFFILYGLYICLALQMVRNYKSAKSTS